MTDDSPTPPVDLAGFSLFDPAVQQCPYPYYAEMRRRSPVFDAGTPMGSLYLVTKHEHVTEVVKDVATFSSRFDTSGSAGGAELTRRIDELYRVEGGFDRVGTMLTVDPPEHTRYRRLVSKAFTPRVVAELEPTIRQICAELIDGLISVAHPDRTVDFVDRFAVPLPVTVIANALNVPGDRLEDFKRWSDASVAGIGTNIGIEERLAAEREVIEFQKYFAAQLDQRRAKPRDDLLTNLLTAQIDRDEADASDTSAPVDPAHADSLTMPEMLSIIQQLLVAGNETTTKLLTEMMRLLGEHPDEFMRLKADPDRARAVVEESLRLSTPTQGMFRIVRAHTDLADCPMSRGDRAVVMFAAANRDPEVFPDPDRFDPDRNNLTEHLAFGKGPHFCLGAALARLEARVAAEELAARIKTFELTDSNDFAYDPSFLLRGLTKLDLTLTPEPAQT